MMRYTNTMTKGLKIVKFSQVLLNKIKYPLPFFNIFL